VYPVLEQHRRDAVANVVEPDPGCQAGSPGRALAGQDGPTHSATSGETPRARETVTSMSLAVRALGAGLQTVSTGRFSAGRAGWRRIANLPTQEVPSS
jgi:hypothetical protein